MALKRQHAIFIKEMNQHGDQQRAYLAAYPEAKPQTARVNSSKLLRRANIVAAIKEYSEKVTALATERAVEELKDAIVIETLTAERKKELLRLMAEGKVSSKILKPEWDEAAQKWTSKLIGISEPTIAERIKAIEVHNRMVGDNAPLESKSDVTVNGFLDFLKETSVDEPAAD